MAKQQGTQRFSVTYFDGVNSIVQPSLAKKTELSHLENARAPIIGVLEKRKGQVKIGTKTDGSPFYATSNYGIAKADITDTTYQGVFRVSDAEAVASTYTISVHDYISTFDVQMVVSTTTLFFLVGDLITVSEPRFYRVLDGLATGAQSVLILDGTSNGSDIYSLTASDTWTKLSDASAQGIIGSVADFTNVDGNLVMVNGRDHNRMISSNGVTVTDATEAGSLFNSPRAHKTAFYKNRIYLANFTRQGVQYKTTVLRSSYPVGIIALVDGDHTSGTTLNVTDTKYFYSDSGMNTYDIYRGGTKITTVTVSAVNETSVTVGAIGVAINSSDEIWVAGTFNGAKQYRWVNNPTSTGQDVKQYDTFKLSGGDEDGITLLDTIGNTLFIANKNAMMTWNDYSLQNFDLGIGCSSTTGSVKLLGTLYFIHHSGVYATTGTTPTLLSRKVERYISGATKAGIESSAAGYKGNSAFFTIGDVTLYNPDGSYWKTLPDVCLEYSVADRNWYVHTNVPAARFMNFLTTAGTERLLMEHTGAGKSVKDFLNGNTDDGDTIFMRVDTQEIQLMQEFELYSAPIEVATEVDRGSSMKVFIALDSDDFYEIDESAKKGIGKLKIVSKDNTRDLKDEPPICRKLRLSFRDSSKQICRLTQFALIYLPTTLEQPE